MNFRQLIIRAELVLGRIDLNIAGNNQFVQAKKLYSSYAGLIEAWPPNSTVWVDPPRDPLRGTPRDLHYWAKLMEFRASGELRHAIFLKRAPMVVLGLEKPTQFVGCYPSPTAVTRYNIPSYRAEVQVIYIPGLVDNTTGFLKAFADFGDLVKPYRSEE